MWPQLMMFDRSWTFLALSHITTNVIFILLHLSQSTPRFCCCQVNICFRRFTNLFEKSEKLVFSRPCRCDCFLSFINTLLSQYVNFVFFIGKPYAKCLEIRTDDWPAAVTWGFLLASTTNTVTHPCVPDVHTQQINCTFRKPDSK